jgi:hypothetical protein
MSSRLTLEEDLTARFRAWIGRRHCLFFNSGTSALRSALFGLGLPPNSIIGVQAYNYPPVIHAIASLGFIPLLLDIDPVTLCLDPQEIPWARGKGARAIVVTHMWGWLGAIGHVRDACQALGLPLVEDAARAYGARLRGIAAGCWGDVAFFSCQTSKALDLGEGGILVTDSPEIADRAAGLGLPLRSTVFSRAPGCELGFGEKIVMHPSALSAGGTAMVQLDSRVETSRSLFAAAVQRAGVRFGPIVSPGVRGGWSNAAFRSTDDRLLGDRLGCRIVREFETNDVSSWAPEAWFGGRRELAGSMSARMLSVCLNACPYELPSP